MILGDPYEKVIWPPKGLRTTELEDPVRNKFLRMKGCLVGGLRAEGERRSGLWAKADLLTKRNQCIPKWERFALEFLGRKLYFGVQLD